MPLVGSFNSGVNGANFLSPRIQAGAPSTSVASMAPEQREALTHRVFNSVYDEQRGSNIFTRLGGYAAAAPVDLADTFVGSLTPAERGDVWNLVGDYGGEIGRELQDFYERNQSGVELTSGIVGAIGVGYLGGAMILPRISNALARSTSISSSRLWQWGARANASTRARMLDAQMEAAKSGEAFRAWQNTAGRMYMMNRVGKGVGVAAFEEGLIGLSMHENRAIWSEEASENIFWAGLGLGIGGTIGGLGARAEMRRIANAPEQIRLRTDSVDAQGFAQLLENQPESDIIQGSQRVDSFRVKESAKTTALALLARQADPTDAEPAMRRRLDTIRNESLQQATESVQKIASKGVPGVFGSNFAVKEGSTKEVIQEILKDDPTAFHGLSYLGATRDKTLDEVLGKLGEHAEFLMKDPESTAELVRRGRHLSEQQAILFIDGRMMPASTPEAKAVTNYRPGNIQIKQRAKNTAEFEFRTESSSKPRTVNESFDIKGFENLPLVDRLQAVEALHRVFRSMIDSGTEYALQPKMNWFQLDAAIEFERLGGKVQWDNRPVNLVGFHGTDRAFTEFDAAKLGFNTDAESAKEGFFFSKSSKTAERYSMSVDDSFNFNSLFDFSGDLKSLYKDNLTSDEIATLNRALDIQQNMPADTTSRYLEARRIVDEANKIAAKFRGMHGSNIHRSYLTMKNPFIKDYKGSEFRDESYADAIKHAKAKGHDGVIFKNTFDGAEEDDIYVVFDAKQITTGIGKQSDVSEYRIRDAETAEKESLRLKADAIGDVSDLGNAWNRLQWNLPLPTSVERIYDGAGDTIRGVLDAAANGAPLQDLREIRHQLKKMHGFELRREEQVELTGNLFRFNRDSRGNWKDTLLGLFEPEQSTRPLNEHGVAEQIAEGKIWKAKTLLHAEPGDQSFLTDLTNHLLSMPEYRAASSITGLADDQVTGLGNLGSQAIGEFVTREMRARDNQVVLSAQRIREATNRDTDAYLRGLVEASFKDINVRLNSAPAVGSKTLVNQLFSNAQGWDLEDNLVPLSNGVYGFALKKTANNASRLGRQVSHTDLLMNPRTGKEMVVDGLALEFLNAFQEVAKQLLKDKNKLRAAMGLPLLNERNWYFPPRSTKGKLVAFVADHDNQPIPGGLIVAQTRAEFEELLKLKEQELKAAGTPYKVINRDQHPSHGDLWDRAAMDWIDPGIAVAPKRGQRGVLSMETINPNAVGDSMQWIKDQTESLGTGALRVLFDSQLGISRARGATERAVRSLRTRTGAGKKVDDRIRTIWDEYESIILGRTLVDSGKSISGALMNPLEGIINGAIEVAWPAVKAMPTSQIGNWIHDILERHNIKSPRPVKTFRELSNQLGPYTPYKNASDYAEQTLKVQRPPEIRDIAGGLNQISAALMLRYFEIPHAAMNLIGIITTMPSILRSGRAPISATFNTKGGKVGVIDSFRILSNSVGDMLSERSRIDWDYMVKNGDTAQQVAEFNKEMSLIRDRRSFMSRMMLGSGSKQGSKGPKGLFKEKGVDGLISILTDTTEEWSRSYSHFVGLRLADYHGITGMEARHNFAREIANSAIANYSPVNRPEFYQSAFGSMYGLFMSWMQAYNQRLFRWIEDGEYGNVIHQLGMQSVLFGVTSNPGYKLVENAMLAVGVGKDDNGQEATLTDHIYAKFGPIAGQAIARGGLQELGAVLYTRGDMNYRDVTLDPTRLMAGFGVVSKAAAAFKESVQTLYNRYSLEESGRLTEALTRHMPNRVMKGIMVNLLNDGKDIDDTGKIVSENIDGFESIVRAMGLRTTRQQGKIEAFYANRQQQAREAARMEVLRMETRALMRNADWESKLQGVFDKYVRAGGMPEHFRTWIQNQVREATSPRDINALRKALANPLNQNEVWRYEMYGGGN